MVLWSIRFGGCQSLGARHWFALTQMLTSLTLNHANTMSNNPAACFVNRRNRVSPRRGRFFSRHCSAFNRWRSTARDGTSSASVIRDGGGNVGGGHARHLLKPNTTALGQDASLSQHQTLRRSFRAHQNRPNPHGNPTRPSRRNRRNRQNHDRRQPPRQKAEQPKPLCLDCAFQVHVVWCLSFKSMRGT